MHMNISLFKYTLTHAVYDTHVTTTNAGTVGSQPEAWSQQFTVIKS